MEQRERDKGVRAVEGEEDEEEGGGCQWRDRRIGGGALER